LLTFLISRRIRGGGPIPERMARAIREKGLMRHIPEGDLIGGRGVSPDTARLKNWIQYGTPDVMEDAAMQALKGKARRTDKVVLSPFSTTPRHLKSRSGYIGTGGEKYRGSPKLEDKLYEAKQFARTGSDIYPTTISGTSIPRKIWGIRSPERRVEALKKFLKKRLGDDKWIIKDPQGSHSGGVLLSDMDDLVKLVKEHRALKPGTMLGRGKDRMSWRDFRRMSPEHQENWLSYFPEYEGVQTLHRMRRRPKSLIAQRRVDFAEPDKLDRLMGGGVQGQEFRVHTIGSNVIPDTTIKRFGTGRMADISDIIGLRTPSMSKVEKGVEQAMKKLERIDPGYVKNRSFAFDVAIDKRGRPQIIEANPEGFSGLIHKMKGGGKLEWPAAMASHRLISALQRQTTMPLALAQSGLAGAAGGLTYGSTLGAHKIREALAD